MNRQLTILAFGIALSSTIYGMKQELKFCDVVTDYNNSTDAVRRYIVNLLENNSDQLPHEMLQIRDYKSNDLVPNRKISWSHKTFNHKRRSFVNHLRFKYKGVKSNQFNETTFKEKLSQIFLPIEKTLNKKEITIKEKYKEISEAELYNPLCEENDTNGLIYTFKVIIAPFNSNTLNANLLVIQELNDALEEFKKLHNK